MHLRPQLMAHSVEIYHRVTSVFELIEKNNGVSIPLLKFCPLRCIGRNFFLQSVSEI